MTNKEIAKNLIDKIPEYKLIYIIPYLRGAAIPYELLDADTIETLRELQNGGSFQFDSATKDLFNELFEN